MSQNDQSGQTLNSHRLLSAADLLLKSHEQSPNRATLVNVWVGEPAEAPKNAFSAEEWVEAMAFLIWLGLIQPNSLGGPVGKPSIRSA